MRVADDRADRLFDDWALHEGDRRPL